MKIRRPLRARPGSRSPQVPGPDRSIAPIIRLTAHAWGADGWVIVQRGYLDRALDEAGISRGDVYLTNAVKHFKWTERGKRRIHQGPNGTEIRACGFWLDAEFGLVRPRPVVLLGAVAGEAVFGSRFRVGERKGKVEEAEFGPWQGVVVSTIHPSAVLRAGDEETG